MTRQDLEAEFVNLYRKNWNTNEGLTKEKIHDMTTRELKICIESQKRFLSLTEKQRDNQNR
jgi:hypothetical protein